MNVIGVAVKSVLTSITHWRDQRNRRRDELNEKIAEAHKKQADTLNRQYIEEIKGDGITASDFKKIVEETYNDFGGDSK